MKVGIGFFPDVGPQVKSGRDYYAEALELSDHAEELDYDSIRIIEHHGHPYGGYSPSTLVFLSAVAARTKRVRLVSGCVVPIFTHPVKAAGEIAMVDAISAGRLDVGFARAFIPHEFDAFGRALDESRARFEEGVLAIRELLSHENVSFDGPFHRFRDVTVYPRPVQRPTPPFWGAAITTPQSFEWLGRQGLRLMVVPYLANFPQLAENVARYRKAYQEAGHGEVTADHIMVSLHMFAAPDRQTARRHAEPAMRQYIATFYDAVRAWQNRTSPQYQGYAEISHRLMDLTYERIFDEHRALLGTPEDIVASITYLREVFGSGFHASLQVNFGGQSVAPVKESMAIFAKEVLPKLKGLA